MPSHRGVVLLGGLVLAALGACGADGPTASGEAGALHCSNRTIRVAVGQAVVPASPGLRQCSLAPSPGAQYALAWVDPRAINASRTAVEQVFGEYPLRISLLPVNVGVQSPDEPAGEGTAPLVLDAQPMHGPTRTPRSEGVAQTAPRHRTAPWTLNELFPLEDPLTGLPRSARVVRVYDGTTVVVRWEDDPTEDLDFFLAQLDSGYAIFREHALPILRATYVDAMPRSSGAGQTLITLQQQVLIQGQSYAEVSGDTLFAWLELLPYPYFSALRLGQYLAHEFTHLYQRMYLHGSRPLPGIASTWGAAYWADEGAANLISYEMLRRMAGVAPNANFDWRAPTGTLAASYFVQRAQPANGVLTAGYEHAMGFFRDLMGRRMDAGETVDEALRAVARGASEGWYGHDGVTQRQGLVSRMQQRLGTRWTAANALLDWTLSYAGDDLTPNPIYQDKASLRIWQLPAGQAYGWQPDAILDRHTPAVFFFNTYGSPGWVSIVDHGQGIDFEIQGYDVPVEWKLLRIR